MSKLTLTVDPEIIRQAEAYAASQHQSLSKLVEDFLKNLPKAVKQKPELTGITAELAGIIGEDELNNIDSYADELQGKYQ